MRGCLSKWRWNRRRTWTKRCVSDRQIINIIDVKNLNEPKDAHYKIEQHGTLDSCCTSWIIHKNFKGSDVAFECTACKCKIKRSARIHRWLGPPNCVTFCGQFGSCLRKNAASKLENVIFLHWSPPVLIFKSRTSKIRNLTNGCEHGFVRFQNPDRYGIVFPSICSKKSGCGKKNKDPQVLRILANSGS